MTLKKQLIVALTAVGLVPFLIMGVTSYISGSNAVSNEAYAKLEIARDGKKAEIDTYIRGVAGAMDALGHAGDTVALFKELVRLHHEQNVQPTDDYKHVTALQEYRDVTHKYEDYWKLYLNKFHLKDIYMICKPHGHVMYSVEKGADFGTNVGLGKKEHTALTTAWEKVSATQKTAFVDIG